MKILVKSISWMIVSGTLIFLSTLAATGSITASLWSAVTASIVKTAVYGVHESVFDKWWPKVEEDQRSSYYCYCCGD